MTNATRVCTRQGRGGGCARQTPARAAAPRVPPTAAEGPALPPPPLPLPVAGAGPRGRGGVPPVRACPNEERRQRDARCRSLRGRWPPTRCAARGDGPGYDSQGGVAPLSDTIGAARAVRTAARGGSLAPAPPLGLCNRPVLRRAPRAYGGHPGILDGLGMLLQPHHHDAGRDAGGRAE